MSGSLEKEVHGSVYQRKLRRRLPRVRQLVAQWARWLLATTTESQTWEPNRM